jgi:hypothetical protein
MTDVPGTPSPSSSGPKPRLVDPLRAASTTMPVAAASPVSAPGPTSPAPSAAQEPAPSTAQETTPPSVEAGKPFRGIPESDDPLKRDFRLFLIALWRWFGFGDPSELQLSMAWYLQWGPDRAIIMAFRGCAKSWITAAYAMWCLYCDANLKILVVSGSLKRSVAFTTFCLTIIREWPLLQHLYPGPKQRQSATAFDVSGARPDQSPSLHAAGVTGQIVGFRAHIIVPDDVETNTNSLTVVMRSKIREMVQEFEAILFPGGVIKYLGTPHSEDSLYPYLFKEMAYQVRIWPVLYPTTKEAKVYGDRLAPYIKWQLQKNPRLVGESTEPRRFPMEDILKRRANMTQVEFRLQYLLDTSLADAERYPLKLANLIVWPCDASRGPDHLAWGKGEELIVKDLPNLGFEGDYFHKPANVSPGFSEWGETVAWIDPAGKLKTQQKAASSDEAAQSAQRDKNETSIAIVSELNGLLYVRCVRGWLDGFAPSTLKMIAKLLVEYGVDRATVESNFGDGMFLALLQPYVDAEWKAWWKYRHARPEDQQGTTMEEVRAVRVQKETRILTTLEPLSSQHRIVMDRAVIEHDYLDVTTVSARQDDEEAVGKELIGRQRYSLIYQWSHLTREKDSLALDDRLDSLCGACTYFAPSLGVDPKGLAARSEEERLLRELGALQDEDGDPSETGRMHAARPRKR